MLTEKGKTEVSRRIDEINGYVGGVLSELGEYDARELVRISGRLAEVVTRRLQGALGPAVPWREMVQMRLARLLRSHVGEVVAVFALLVVQAVCELSLPRYMSDIVNVGVVGAETGNSAYLGHMALVMFGFCAGSLVAAVLTGLIASRVAAAVARDLRRKVFAKVMSFSPAEVNRFSQSSLITRCTNDVQQIQNMIVMMLRMVMLAPVMGVVAVVQVMTMGGGLAWIVGAALLAVLGVMAVLFTFTMPRFKAMQTLVDRVNLIAREMLDGIMTIRAFGRQDHELTRFDGASGDLRDAQLFVNRAMMLMMPLMMLVMNVTTVAIVWFGAHEVAAGAMQAGDMMAFISYAMMIVMSFLIVSMVAVILPRAEVSVGRVQEVLDVEPAVREAEHSTTPAADAPSGRLVFDHVSFHYPDAERDVVSDVSFATAPARLRRSLALRARASRRSCSWRRASTTPRPAPLRSTGWTRERCPSRTCARAWATYRSRAFSSRAPLPRTWPLAQMTLTRRTCATPSTWPRPRSS